ncbi:protein of unknown function DUF77 [Desulfovibrio sp. X2]|uniref:MTH1187 family thiamine-binding protein n=1 Tax=Desulfovibrio sp. X2 TaxID=941449 RepID=UPI0003589C04|nr:MTH1187 family thiamine-binding protein [Desulfovibrio sp. X2]EPR42652.1 protein of unknown function DUF77 [Desulfovibrio sp. X2]
MSVLAELSIFPVGLGDSLSEHVAGAVRIIRESGLAHEFGPMGTCIEGEWGEVMDVVGRCHAAMRERSARVYMTLKVDSREGQAGRLSSKIASVEGHLAAREKGE